MMTEILMGVGEHNPPAMTDEQTRQILRDANIPEDLWQTVTGMGHRRGFGSAPDDTVLSKLASGALSIIGVCGVLYGTDSEQHHRGHNWGPIVRLECACCGSGTPGRQWWNQDAGWGLCAECVGFCTRTKADAEAFGSRYGILGVHCGTVTR